MISDEHPWPNIFCFGNENETNLSFSGLSNRVVERSQAPSDDRQCCSIFQIFFSGKLVFILSRFKFDKLIHFFD